MKYRVSLIGIFFSLCISIQSVFAHENKFKDEISCVLSGGKKIVLKSVLRSLMGRELYLEIDGKIKPAFFSSDMSDDDFIGDIVLETCVNHVMVFVIEWGPPYLKGVAIRQNPITHLYERIDFSEKALPRWLYLDNYKMVVIIPNIGHETDKKYLAYFYINEKGQIKKEDIDTNSLPVPHSNLFSIVK